MPPAAPALTGERVSGARIEIAKRLACLRFELSGTESLAIAAFVVLTTLLAASLNVGIDEAYTLETTSRGLHYAWSQALNFELQAPLYFVVMNLWRALGSSIFTARTFSILCVTLTIPLLVRLAGRYMPRVHVGWLLVAFVSNPFVVWAAVEARLYAMLILLSSLFLFLFYDTFLSEGSSRPPKLLFGMVALAGLYTQYYFGFLLVACALVLLALGRWRDFWAYVAVMVAVGICATPLLLSAWRQCHALTSTVTSSASWADSLHIIYARTKDYLLPTDWLPLSRWRGKVVAGSALAFVLWVTHGGWRKIDARWVALWVVTLVVAAFFAATLQFTAPALVKMRHTAVLFIPVFLAVTATAALPRSNKVLAGWVVVSLLFELTSLCAQQRVLAKIGDWQRVARWLELNERPGQPILVFEAEAAMPLGYYYSGANPIVALPADVKFESYDMRQYALADEGEVAAAIAKAGDPERMWLVQFDLCRYLDVELNCELLTNYLMKRYVVEKEREFFHTRVMLLRKRLEPPVYLTRYDERPPALQRAARSRAARRQPHQRHRAEAGVRSLTTGHATLDLIEGAQQPAVAAADGGPQKGFGRHPNRGSNLLPPFAGTTAGG